MKVSLINASVGKSSNWSVDIKPRITTYPALSLAILAALTPPEFEVEIINDEFDRIDFNEKTDLAGISFLTAAAPRAYKIADEFRKRGVKVVLGGVHVSALPEEASEHADSVVVGEGEEIWPVLLDDFKNGSLKKTYVAKNPVDLSRIPNARLDLLKRKHYITTNVIQASRGCPFDCEFCSIKELFGKYPRFRPVKAVIGEITAMKRDRVLLFTDDNLVLNPNYAKELFTALIPLKINWIGEASWVIGKKHELLKLLRKSGCIGLLIGFESIHDQMHTKKLSRYKDMRYVYREAVENLHKHKIVVVGAFVFGFDNDRMATFKETLKFCYEAGIDIAEFNSLTPFPGTPIYKRLSGENRIFTRDWSKYTYEPPGEVFYPKNITNAELTNGIRALYRSFYSYKRLLPLLFRTLIRYRNLPKVFYMFLIFMGYRKKTKF